MVINLSLHARDLLVDGFGDVNLTGRARPGGFLRQEGQRCLQAMSEVTGFGNCAPDRLLTVVEQRIEIVDERLNLRRVLTFHPACSSRADAGQACVEVVHGRQASPGMQQRTHEAESGGQHDERRLQKAVQVRHQLRARIKLEHMAEHHAEQEDEADRPKNAGEEHTATQGSHSHDPIR